MTNFERIKMYYEKGWANKEQIREYVKYGVITTEEYESICGEKY